MAAGPPDFNPDGTSHQKPNQNKSRRGRPRHIGDRNLNSNNSYDASQQCGHLSEGFESRSNSNSNYVEHQHPPYRGEDGARWRGRGRGRRGVGSGPRWQRPAGNFNLYSGSSLGAGGHLSGAQSVNGPDGANWWQDDVNRNVEQTNEEQDTQPRKTRKFNQDQRRGEQIKKDTQTEKSTSVRHHTSNDHKGERQPSEGESTQRSILRPDSQRDADQRKPETKRRQGPIKPPKPQPQEEVGVERGASGQNDSDHSRPSQHPACKAWRSSERHAALKARGGRRTHQQHNRPGQRKWDERKMPESRETQTG